ncbi:MAG: HEAT repeat domain-containing protein [Myxococcales bacterium]
MAKKTGIHAERLFAVAASPRLIAVGGRRDAEGVTTSAVYLFDAKGTALPAALPCDAAVGALCLMADDVLLAGTASGALLGWAAGEATPTQVLTAKGHGQAVRALACDTLGRLFASTDGHELLVGQVDLRAGKATLLTLAHRRLDFQCQALAVDPTGRIVAAGGEDGVIRTWSIDALTGAPHEMACGDAAIRALAFIGDGRIAAGSADGGIRLCFLEGEADVQDRSGDAAHLGPVRGLVVCPALVDEAGHELPRRLYSAGEDGVLKAWFLEGKRKPKSVEFPGGALTAMTWQPLPATATAQSVGQLAITTFERRLLLVAAGKEGELADTSDEVEPIFARLSQDLSATGPRAVPGRVAAVKALAQLPEDDARVLLERALADQAKEVRLPAATALAAATRRQSRPALRKSLDDADLDVRKAAYDSLVALESDAPLNARKAALSAKFADVRARAVADLPALASLSPVVPGLVAARLSDSDAPLRLKALDALLKIDGSTLEPIRAALAHGTPDVRSEVLARLVFSPRMALPGAEAILQEALDDEAPEVRETAYALGLWRKPALASKLRKHDLVLDKKFAELEKRGAVTPQPGDELAPLFAAFASRRPDSMLRGALGLALLGDERATGAILQFSREPDANLRRSAVHALALAAKVLTEDERIPARLAWLLDDADASVRGAAFDALTELAANRAVQLAALAESALRSSHEDIRVRALQIVVKLGGPGAADAAVAKQADALLGDALDDEAAKVRSEAFRTLWAWHPNDPEIPLTRGVRCRHGDIRGEVVEELARLQKKYAKADEMLLALCRDSVAAVALAAYDVFTKDDGVEINGVVSGDKALAAEKARHRKRPEVHLAAMASPRPEVRAKALAGCTEAPAAALRTRIVELIKDEHPPVFLAAIEAYDKLLPKDQEGFALAFGSRYWDLRVRAAELLARRHDDRATEPMRSLLTIPKGDLNRPSDVLRQRAAGALAEVADPKAISFLQSLLDDEDGLVREMGARGLATTCPPGGEQPLLDALAHADLAVRSWAAEGLARLGDPRALPVLAGTQKHEHRPIRIGAILGFVALGAEGVRGLRQALSDPDREVQDLALSVIVARDLALQQAGLEPDLLYSTLTAAHPEIRFAGARILEARAAGEPLATLARELVGPRQPEKASDMKNWPKEETRASIQRALVSNLASDHPGRRYAAARVLSMRNQPEAFWREAERLTKPGEAIPFTSWSDEKVQPRKQGWVRRLLVPATNGKPKAPAGSGLERLATVLRFAGGATPAPVPAEEGALDPAAARKLVFGVYAGLIRQAPPAGEADETHRVRRDALDRVSQLASEPAIGRAAVLPVLERALSDPNHLVRLAALEALRKQHPAGSLEPLQRALQAEAGDVGRAAVDELLAAALKGDAQAAALLKTGLEAPSAEVRAEVLLRLPKLWPSGELEPWLLALESRYADVRLAVVDRLADATDPRVAEALGRALASEHVDLRLKAAKVLANRGDPKAADVLAGFLRIEDQLTNALDALVALAHARPNGPQADLAAQAAALAVAARLEDDPDKTAPRERLVEALARIAHPAAQPALLRLLSEPDPKNELVNLRQRALDALMALAVKKGVRPQRLADGTERRRYDEPRALAILDVAARHSDVEIRKRACERLKDVDDAGAEAILARLLSDRIPEIRVAAAEALAFRVEHVPNATLDALAAALRGGRRELVLPAAMGLAARKRKEAFQALLLVVKAGEGGERERALLAMGSLGDRRALEPTMALLDPALEDEQERALAPAAAEALGRMLPGLEGDEAKEVREKLEQLATGGPADQRMRALVGLRHAGDARSRALLEKIAVDGDEPADVRVVAVTQLGLLKDPASEPALAAALTAPGVQQAARTALERLFPDDRARVALHLMQSRWPQAVEEAAAFLALHADPGVVTGFLEQIKDREARARLRWGLVRRQAAPTAQLKALLEGKSVPARAEAAWVAGAAASPEARGRGRAGCPSVRGRIRGREAACAGHGGSSDPGAGRAGGGLAGLALGRRADRGGCCGARARGHGSHAAGGCPPRGGALPGAPGTAGGSGALRARAERRRRRGPRDQRPGTLEAGEGAAAAGEGLGARYRGALEPGGERAAGRRGGGASRPRRDRGAPDGGGAQEGRGAGGGGDGAGEGSRAAGGHRGAGPGRWRRGQGHAREDPRRQAGGRDRPRHRVQGAQAPAAQPAQAVRRRQGRPARRLRRFFR